MWKQKSAFGRSFALGFQLFSALRYVSKDGFFSVCYTIRNVYGTSWLPFRE